MVDLTGIDIHAPQQTHPKCSTRASGLWPSPPFNANIVFRGRRQPFISNYIVNCYTSSYYAILLYCSMLQHVAVSYSIHSITPSPDILTISRCLWMSLVLAFSHQCVPFRWSHGPGTWRPMWPVPGISAFVLSKLGETWIWFNIFTDSSHIFTDSSQFLYLHWDFAPVLCCSWWAVHLCGFDSRRIKPESSSSNDSIRVMISCMLHWASWTNQLAASFFQTKQKSNRRTSEHKEITCTTPTMKPSRSKYAIIIS